KAISYAPKNLRGKNVLDIGFGRGEILIHLAKKGANAYGADYSQASVAIAKDAAKKAGVKVKFERKEVTELDYPENFFDAVFMLDVVEHLTDAQLEKCFASVRKSLTKNGVFVIHTMPNKFLAIPFYAVSKITHTKRGVNEEVHINEQTPSSLKSRLKGYDVEIQMAHEKNYFKNTQFYAAHRRLIKPFVDIFLAHDFSKLPVLKYFLASEIWACARAHPKK
ncbi:MAG: class I SAM-dependent methyltransferase, partial [archaeon]|nr:class I SAM-dependent methyltransferase [archaeon]